MAHLRLIFVVALAGCWTAARYSEWRMESFQREALPRAAFELECPKEKLAVVDLSAGQESFLGSVGVSGCGRRAVYLLQNSGWVNNTGYETVPAKQ